MSLDPQDIEPGTELAVYSGTGVDQPKHAVALDVVNDSEFLPVQLDGYDKMAYVKWSCVAGRWVQQAPVEEEITFDDTI